jgi:hypothetical protein
MNEQMAFDLPDLFGEQRPNANRVDSIAKMNWSYSKRGTLEQCPRRYYYTYYAAKRRNIVQDPQAHLLSHLQNRHERIGQILHLVISTFLRKARSGDVWTTNRLTNWAESLFSKDCDYSQRLKIEDGTVLVDNNTVVLQEFYYRETDAEALCTTAGQRLVNAVAEFAENRAFAVLRESGMDPEASIELPIKVGGLPCVVNGRIDLAYQENDDIVVVDWKTGGTQGGDDSLQLATYGMWSISRYKTSPGNIRIHKALLIDGNLTTARIDDKMLARARARIIQDAELMATLDNYGREGIVAAFSPCAQPAVCALCRFRKICDGRANPNARN